MSAPGTFEIILYNGVFHGSRLDQPIQPGVQAIGIGDGKILAMGGNDDILSLAHSSTAKINLNGRLVVPGFIDSHIHFYEWSLKLGDLQLEKLKSIEELFEVVKQRSRDLPTGQWIMGQGWNETDWPEAVMPNRTLLDQVAPDHPVLLWRCDLHLAVANSKALQIAGIDHNTADPPEGRIERDSSGNPTGILRELAINLVRQAVAPPTEAQIENGFQAGTHELYKLGITGIHDIRLMHDEDGARSFQICQQLDRQKELGLRCWMSFPGHQLDELISLGLRSGFGSDRLRIGHVKFFSDGGMGARTAWMLEPFLDAGCGMVMVDMAELRNDIEKADRNGLAVMVHAVGDRANRELINLFSSLEEQRAQQQDGTQPYYPHRIEHMQMIRPEDAKQLRDLNLAVCVTPYNMILDINLIDHALGELGKWTYSFRRLFDTGAPIMFSSDCPVCHPDPLPAIRAAVTRIRLDGSPAGGWYPDQRVSIAEAVAAYTSIPARVHKAYDLGSLTPGCQADLAILSHDIFAEPADLIGQTAVDMTIFAGQIVHRTF